MASYSLQGLRSPQRVLCRAKQLVEVSLCRRAQIFSYPEVCRWANDPATGPSQKLTHLEAPCGYGWRFSENHLGRAETSTNRDNEQIRGQTMTSYGCEGGAGCCWQRPDRLIGSTELGATTC